MTYYDHATGLALGLDPWGHPETARRTSTPRRQTKAWAAAAAHIRRIIPFCIDPLLPLLK